MTDEYPCLIIDDEPEHCALCDISEEFAQLEVDTDGSILCHDCLYDESHHTDVIQHTT